MCCVYKYVSLTVEWKHMYMETQEKILTSNCFQLFMRNTQVNHHNKLEIILFLNYSQYSMPQTRTTIIRGLRFIADTLSSSLF
jgi:hypothetical protein